MKSESRLTGYTRVSGLGLWSHTYSPGLQLSMKYTSRQVSQEPLDSGGDEVTFGITLNDSSRLQLSNRRVLSETVLITSYISVARLDP